jgi:hypothetical protein
MERTPYLSSEQFVCHVAFPEVLLVWPRLHAALAKAGITTSAATGRNRWIKVDQVLQLDDQTDSVSGDR